MSRAVLLDPVTGRPGRGESERAYMDAIVRAPAHVLDLLEKANQEHPAFKRRRSLREMPLATMNSWEEVVYSSVADAAAFTGTAEGVIVPDVNNFVFPANALTAGSLLKVTLRGVLTTDATPATLLLRLRWSAVGSGAAGTQLAAMTAATAPSASQTNASWQAEFITSIRAGASTATAALTSGFLSMPGQARLLIPATGSAAVNIDTTVARILAPTAIWSAAESLTVQQFIVEWMR